MKGIVFLMIAIMLIGAFIIARGGGGDGKTFFGIETEYCRKVAERKRAIAEGDYSGEYRGRFADFLHGCF